MITLKEAYSKKNFDVPAVEAVEAVEIVIAKNCTIPSVSHISELVEQYAARFAAWQSDNIAPDGIVHKIE